ncbi:hypothetical protein [Tropicimonas isoalkanivorans]|uniref:Uncharacterized protein n=1 Tax=Tropicimonas isoalkanivorans TaxID=441112 RepID=A0A1I1MSD0_9RHOB|nr:hypothetical protein [Tropicimonas isoalkanivorans]SFC84460.1 hypothetical protein SAMN04488094_11016 [Tropicimonas isoalkanivorans]
MATERKSFPKLAAPAGDTGLTRNRARMAAIPMIALGAACCASIEIVKSTAPDLATLPGLAGSVLALGGLLLLFKSQLAEKRATAAAKRRYQRIAPYLPEMTDGSGSAKALAAALAPVEKAIEPAVRLTVVSAEAVARAPRRQKNGAGASVTLFQHDPASDDHRGASTPIFAAMRLGGNWAEGLKLSPKAMARFESDPFVQRLARIG